MILRSLHLRGAIGMKNGLGKEDVTIDFTKFAPGLIAIVGPNGAGKTTLIENLTPYRLLKSRPGGLARQFFLKDSCRDLLVSMNGDEYRFLLNINGISGKLESCVYRNGEALNPDGKEGTYTEIVTRLFGEPALFFASLFMPQHRSRFSDLAPAESKILLLKLIGADRLQAKCDHAVTQGKALNEQIGKIESSIQFKIEALAQFTSIDADIETTTQMVNDKTDGLEDISAQIEDLVEQVRLHQEVVTAQAVTESQLQQARARLNELLRERSAADVAGHRKIDELHTNLRIDRSCRDGMKETHTPERLKIIEELVIQADRVKADYLATVESSRKHAELNTQLARTREQYANAKGKHESERQQLQADSKKAETNLSNAETSHATQIRRLKEDIERKRRSIDILSTVPCQTGSADIAATCESCQFLKDAIRAKEEVTHTEQHLSETEISLQGEITRLMGAVDTAHLAHQTFGEWVGSEDEFRLRTEGESIRAEIEAMSFDSAAATQLRLKHEAFERENPAKARAAWDATEREIEDLTDRVNENTQRLTEAETELVNKLAELSKESASLEAEAQALEASIDPFTLQKLNAAKASLEQKRGIDKSLSETLARLRTELNIFQCDKKRSEALAAELESDRAALALLQTNQADWNHLSLSLSRNGGFQSILVESAGAEMSPYADRMLALYGRSWTMEFATSRLSDDGKKMVEGFYVTINTPDGPRELSALSGGEEVIADQVIYDAIGNMLRRRSGLDLRTAIKDEADGSLDSNRAIDYIRAVEAGHIASGLHHTILITHRDAIQDMISQRIRLVPGAGIVTEVG